MPIESRDSRAVFPLACITKGEDRSFCARCGVRETALCAALEADEIQYLNAIATPVSKSRNRVIFMEHEPSHRLFVLTEGTVRLSKLMLDGRRQITGFLFPGDFLGEAVRGQYGATAEAVTDCRLCSFSYALLHRLADRFPRLKDRMMEGTSSELDQAQEHILLLGQKRAEERVATMLVSFSRRLAGEVKDGARFQMSIDRQDLADYLGLRIETVSRVMSRFRRQALIAEARGVLTLTAAEPLLKLARGGEDLDLDEAATF